MKGRREVDEKGADQTGIGNPRYQHHQNPDEQQFFAVEPDGVFQQPPAEGHDKGQPEENEEGCQGKVAAT